MASHILLAETTITSSTANVIFDGYLDDTAYKGFQIIFTDVTSDSASASYMRQLFRDGGSDITTTDSYNRHFIYSYSYGAGGTAQWVNGEYLEINGTLDNGGDNFISGDFIMYHTNDSSSEIVGTFRTLNTTPDGNMHFAQGGVGNTNHQTMDGMKFYLNGGNFATGNFRLYGIKA